jgi:hypothetical protein
LGETNQLDDAMTSGEEILFLGHLGLGDHLICGPIVRSLAKEYSTVAVLCKTHNLHTVSFFFRDVSNIECFSVADDDEAIAAKEAVCKEDMTVVGLGVWSDKPFDRVHWDKSFYDQAGMDFQDRWSQFTCVRQPSRELEVPEEPYCLIHEDKKRGYLIDRKRLPKLPIVEITPEKTANLFDWWGLVESATELHLMESCVAILADSLPEIRARRKVIHHYTRQSTAPTYRLDYEHLH